MRERVKLIGWKDKWIMFFMIYFTILLYYPGLFYDFVGYFDDDWGIVENLAIRDLSLKGVIHLFFNDKNDFQYNPLSFLSFAVDYHFWGLHPIAYKTHNLVLHLACGILLYTFVKTLTGNRFVSFFTAFVFMIHPMNIESVTWAAARRQSLFFFYLLLSMQLFLLSCRRQEYRWTLFILAVILGVVSILAKATAIIFPFVFLLIYLIETGKIDKRILLQFFVTLPIIIIFTWLSLRQDDLNYLKRDFDYTLFEHLTFAGYSYFFYWYKTFLLLPNAIFYPAPSENLNILPLQYYFFLVFSLLILGVIFYHFLKKQWLKFFALMYYSLAIGSLLNLMLFPLGDLPMLVADRYYYHSGWGIVFYISLFVSPLYYKHKGIITTGVVVYIVALMICFRLHQPVWKNIITLLENNNKHYPSEEMLYRQALEYYSLGDKENAFRSISLADSMGTDIWINHRWDYYIDRSRIYTEMGDCLNAAKDLNTAYSKLKDVDKGYSKIVKKMIGDLNCE